MYRVQVTPTPSRTRPQAPRPPRSPAQEPAQGPSRPCTQPFPRPRLRGPGARSRSISCIWHPEPPALPLLGPCGLGTLPVSADPGLEGPLATCPWSRCIFIIWKGQRGRDSQRGQEARGEDSPGDRPRARIQSGCGKGRSSRGVRSSAGSSGPQSASVPAAPFLPACTGGPGGGVPGWTPS